MKNESQPNPASLIVFGPFEFDLHSGDLTKSGTPIRLTGKPLRILLLLINRPGHIVSREELRQNLWEDTAFGDFEHGLNSAVNKLRQSLGDSADRARYIETVAGHGYRFIAPVQAKSVIAPVRTLPVAPAALRLEPPPKKLRTSPYVLGAGAVVLLGGVLTWITPRSSTPAAAIAAPPVRFAVHPPPGFATEGAASRQSLALSPDGSKLAFTAMDASGSFSLFIRDFTALESRRIPNTEGAHTMFWPPDGRSIYLTRRGRLWQAQLQGDAHVSLSETPPFLFSGTWLGPDRLYLDAYQASVVASPLGPPWRRLDQVCWWPHPLPDGRHLLCLADDAKTGVRYVRLLRTADFSLVKNLFPSSGRVQYVASTVTPQTGYLLYVRAGSLLARPFDPRKLETTGDAVPVARNVYHFTPTGAGDFSASRQGTIAYHSLVSRTHLAWVDRTGRELEAVGPANTNVKSGRLSPDGKWVAAAIYDVEHGQQDIWIFDTTTNEGRRLAPEAAMRDAPVWSPDSQRIAYMYYSSGSLPPDVRIRGLGAADREELAPTADFQAPVSWSPNGRFLTFMNTGFPRLESEKQSDMGVFDFSHQGRILPLLNTLFHEAWGTFSPDGKWMAFQSNESGRGEIYVQAFHGGNAPGLTGPRYLASRGGAAGVRWRADGKELYFLDYSGQVRSVPVLRLDPVPEFGPPAPLFKISTEAQAAIHSIASFDVSPGGSRFLIPVVSSVEGPAVVVIQNWESLLP